MSQEQQTHPATESKAAEHQGTQATSSTGEPSTEVQLPTRLFSGHDPFCEFSVDPLTTGGWHSSFGSRFGRVVQRLENLSEELLGIRPSFLRPITPEDATHYSFQTATMHSFVGKDGKVHSEQYVSSDAGHREHQIRETHQAYANSETGVSKRALEQHLGPRAMKTVKVRGADDKEDTKEMLLGMETTEKEGFHKDFTDQAHHLPEHQSFHSDFFRDFGSSAFPAIEGLGKWSQHALEAGRKGGA
jgi:hypothetical protein